VPFCFVEAYALLLYFHLYLARGDFGALYRRVRNHPVRPSRQRSDPTNRISSNVDLACIWYWKRVLCLQRSAATTCLLRRHGIPAQMVIGARQMPFRAHAWVEVEGRVVNDKPYMPEIYAVLERC